MIFIFKHIQTLNSNTFLTRETLLNSARLNWKLEALGWGRGGGGEGSIGEESLKEKRGLYNTQYNIYNIT